jgi:hypothetical protein
MRNTKNRKVHNKEQQHTARQSEWQQQWKTLLGLESNQETVLGSGATPVA